MKTIFLFSHKLMEDPHILASCDHYFCKYVLSQVCFTHTLLYVYTHITVCLHTLTVLRRCILSSLVTHSMCPSCGLPAWVKDVKPNHQLNNVITSLHMLKSVIGSPPQDCEPVDGNICNITTHSLHHSLYYYCYYY